MYFLLICIVDNYVSPYIASVMLAYLSKATAYLANLPLCSSLLSNPGKAIKYLFLVCNKKLFRALKNATPFRP